MVICLELGADLHMAKLMPLPLTVSCFGKIQIGFTFLVPAHLGSYGKGPLNGCVCVCVRACVCVPVLYVFMTSIFCSVHSINAFRFVDFIWDPTSSTGCFRRLLKTYLFARY